MDIDELQNICIILLALCCAYFFIQNRKLKQSDTIRARLIYEIGKISMPIKELTDIMLIKIDDNENRLDDIESRLDDIESSYDIKE